MRCWFIGTMDTQAPSEWVVESGSPLQNAATVRDHLASLRALPLAIVWPGLAADVAIHAAAWLAMLTGLAFVWSWVLAKWRTPKGCCPACGYDLRGGLGAGCPECGWNRTPDPASDPVQ
jgi:hypothetical protein